MRIASLFIFSICLYACTKNQNQQKMPIPPIAKKIAKDLIIHGDTRVDNYYWMNDQENPEVIKYLEEENSYQEAILADTKEIQGTIYNEIVGRIKQDDASVPVFENGYYTYRRYEEGKDYPIYCRKKGSLDALEEILYDCNQLAEGSDFYNASSPSISDNNKILCFGEDTLGRRIYKLRFKDIETDQFLPLEIANTTGSCAWAADNETVFYAEKDETLRPFKIFRININSGQKELVFEESDNTFYSFVYRSKSSKHIMIGSVSTLTTEYRFLDAATPNDNFKIISKRTRGHEYFPAHINDKFIIRTNKDGATNFKLCIADESRPEKDNWVEMARHNQDILIEDIEVCKKFFVVQERYKGLSRIYISDYGMKIQKYIPMNDDAYAVYLGGNADFEASHVRYIYESMTTPSSVFDFDIHKETIELKKQQEIVGGYDPNLYKSERLMIEVRDGEKVPVSLVYKKDTEISSKTPLIMEGYGSYGYSSEADFSISRLSLLDRGYAYAIAHIRGGEEMGRQWYENGKLLKKKNTFYDFIDCGKGLIEKGYTSSSHLYAIGGSAGGLLMGAVINMEPELFNGVIAAVPFVDVVTTMLDETIPLTTGEYDEWGNPNEKAFYDYILSYSPYDNIESKNYPNLLITSGLHDLQVQYWEPTKWCAKLRELKTDDKVLLLYTNMDAGHGGASGRFSRIKEVAREWAFFLKLENKI